MLRLTVHKSHPLPSAPGADLACSFPEDRACEQPKSCRFELLCNLCLMQKCGWYPSSVQEPRRGREAGGAGRLTQPS